MPNVQASPRLHKPIVSLFSSLGGAWALLILLAHMAGLRGFAALGRDYVVMSRPAATLMLSLSAALLVPSGKSGRGSRVALALAGLVAVASLWVLAIHALGPQVPGLPLVWSDPGTHQPRLSILTTGCILGLAVAIGLIRSSRGDGWRIRQAAAIVVLVPLGAGVVVLVSYAAGIPLFYGTATMPMTLPAALIGQCLGLAALVASGADTWPLALFGSAAADASPRRFWRVRWASLGVFLVLTSGILGGGIFILKGQLKTVRLLVEDELSAIGDIKADQIADWYRLRGGEAAQLAPVTTPWPRSLPTAETLLIGRDQGDAVYLSGRRLPGRRLVGDRVSIAAQPGLVAVMAANGREGIVEGVDYRGQQVVGALRRVPGTPWFLVTKVDQLEVNGPMRQRAWSTGLLLLGMITLVGLGIGLVVRHQDAKGILGQLAFERERKALAERSEHLMRHANDMILLSDLDGRILEANVAASEHFGCDSGGFRRLRLRDLRDPESTAQLLERFEALKAAGSARFESVFRRMDGTEFPAEVSARVISLGGASIVLHFIRDITERKGAEAALRASEEKFSKAFATSPDAIAINRLADGTYLNVNPSFCKMTGYLEQELLGHSSRAGDRGIWFEDADRVRLVTGLLQHEQMLGFEAPFRAKDGHRIIGRMSAALLEIGGERCLLTITRDITRVQEAEEERRQLETRLHQSQKLESLGSLAGGVAHDMNNVLGAILSLASARREGLDPSAPMAATLDTIATACLRGRGVVQSLLYFSRKDLQETKPLDLNELVRDVVQLLGYTTLKRIRLEMDLQESLPAIQGDGGALSHALVNLCVNALDAMPGRGDLRLATEALADGRVRLRVEDNGEGMTEAVLAKAVEPFYTTKPLGKGTGLGLAMVFGTMKAHGGDLDIKSRPGHGTQVILTFPALVAGPGSPETGPGPEWDAHGGSLRILVVDDDELIRESLIPMLEILGHTAQAAAGGLEAMAMFQDGLAVDLVILDMNMPGLNGAETLTRIKALRPGQVVLMSSGYNDSDVNELVSGHSGVHCIQKPFSMSELRRKLDGIPLESSSS